MLELRNVSFHVVEDGRKKEIVKDISLKVDNHEFLVITGPNGSGKSTLARLIAGIEVPTSGEILLDGVDIAKWSITDRARAGIGFAFQQPVRFKGITVHDLLSLSAGRDLNFEEACGYLSEVGLCAMDYVQREVNAKLSGGELKRIEIAILIAREPKLSLFDEPEAGIDLWSFNNLIRVFENIRSQSKSSVMIISHQERIMGIADRIVVLAGGELTQVGSRDEVLPGLLNEVGTCEYFKGGVPA